MSELSKMPMATVEQQAAFRKAALDREDDLVSEIERLSRRINSVIRLCRCGANDSFISESICNEVSKFETEN